jgi:hypothetical protein
LGSTSGVSSSALAAFYCQALAAGTSSKLWQRRLWFQMPSLVSLGKGSSQDLSFLLFFYYNIWFITQTGSGAGHDKQHHRL